MPTTTWPVTIGGETFTEADFSGNNYVTGLPRLMAAAVRQGAENHTSTSTTAITVGLGAINLTVEAAKPWGTGQPVRIARTSAPTTVYLDAIVTAYNATTGAMTVEVVATKGAGVYGAWTLTLGGARIAGSASPLPVGEGGTGSTDAASARTALGLGSAATQNTTAFATAAQGSKADGAVQQTAIGINPNQIRPFWAGLKS